jgi:membrane-associated protein
MVIEGPIVTIISGFLISSGHLNVIATFLMLVAGDIAGDALYYKIGSMSTGQVLVRWGRFFGICEKKVSKVQALFHIHKTKALLIGKWSHAIGAPILVAAGMAGIPFRQFIGINLLATLPKTLALLLIGFFFGHNYAKIATYLNYYTLIIIVLIIGFLVSLTVYGKISRKLNRKVMCKPD